MFEVASMQSSDRWLRDRLFQELGTMADSLRVKASRIVRCITIPLNMGLAIAVGLPGPVGAQLIPDQSLGDERSRVVTATPQSGTPEFPVMIQGGAARDLQLFHSFQDFNVGAGQQVYFANPSGIEQIFSRVTGGTASQIEGLLGVAGPADLFLLNPQSIVFGPNAKLDIAGSFLGTTATTFEWGDGQQFGLSSSIPTPTAPLLTTALQPGLQWGLTPNREEGKIVNRADLTVGKDLRLVADNLDLQGRLQAKGAVTLQARNLLQVRDQISQPFVAVSGGQLLLQGDESLDIIALTHAESQLIAGGALLLRSGNSITGDAQFRSGGDFQIQQLDERPGSFQSPQDPVIRAGGNVSFTDYRGSSLHILAGGQVSAEDITILSEAVGTVTEDFLRETVPLSNGSSLAIDGSARPTVDIRAGIAPSAIGNALGAGLDIRGDSSGFNPAPTGNDVPTSANITIGEINLDAGNGQVFLTNQYQANRNLTGDIILNVLRGHDGGGDRFTGSGTDITVDAKQNFRIGDRIDASSKTGDAGSIQLLAQGTIDLDQSYLTSNNNGPFSPGNIDIQTSNLNVLNGSQIQINTAGLNDAGSTNIIATGDVVFDSFQSFSSQPAPQLNPNDIRAGIDNRIFGNNSASPTTVNSGGIKIEANNIKLLNGSQLQVSVNENSPGVAGDIDLFANDSIRIEGIHSNDKSVDSINSSLISDLANGSEGQAGNIFLRANNIDISNSSRIQSNTSGMGNGGRISLEAAGGRITLLNDVKITANLEEAGSGKAGNISLEGSIITVAGGETNTSGDTKIESRNRGDGSGGNITLRAEQIEIPYFVTIVSSIEKQGSGKAGNILIDAQEFKMNASSLQTNVLGQGEGGSVTIKGSDFVKITDSPNAILTRVNKSGTGQGGNAFVETPNLQLLEGSRLVSNAEGKGPAGNIRLDVREVALIQGISQPDSRLSFLCPDGSCQSSLLSRVESSAQGLESRSGSITITAEKLDISESGRIDVSSENIGDAGKINIATVELEIRSGGQIRSSATSQGQGGSITINAQDSIVVANAASSISAETENVGKAGSIVLRTPNLSVENEGEVATASRTGATGSAGGITITPGESPRLDINLSGGKVTAETQSRGDGGDVILSAPEAVIIRGQGILTAQTSDTGSAGNVRVTTDRLTLDQGTTLSTTATAAANPPANEDGSKANIDLNANEMNLFGTVQVLSETQGNARAGRLTLQSNGGQDLNISLKDSSRVSASTSGSGAGGQLRITAPSAITISGDGNLSAETLGAGRAGEVIVSAQEFTLDNRARLSTSTSGSGDGGNIRLEVDDSIRIANQAQLLAQSTGNASAGNIDLRTGQLELKNRAGITVRSANTGDGGNITINATRPILMEDRSVIETDAGGSGNGGNIAVTTPFLVGLKTANVDIIANAVSGNGGKVTIEAQRILNFGIQDGQDRSSLRSNGSNDISASSETGTSGTVALNTLDVDPSRGLAELPVDLTDPGDRITRSCRASSGENSFVTSGRGGIPQGPDAPLRSSATPQGWITPSKGAVSQQTKVVIPTQSKTGESVEQITEVRGWEQDSSGQVRLVVEKQEVHSGELTVAAKQVALNCKAEPVHATMPEHD